MMDRPFFKVRSRFIGSRARSERITTEPVYFTVGRTLFTIPIGFEWDGATGAGRVSRFLFGLNKFGAVDRATCIHDYIYEFEGSLPEGILTRKQADQIFRTELRRIGFKGFRLWAIYRAVRIGGFFLWLQP